MSGIVGWADEIGAALKAREQIQNIHSQNIANANTPGYKPKSADFDVEMRKAKNSEEVNSRRYFSIDTESTSHTRRVNSLNNNSVDVREEMTAMAKNEILHETLTKIAAKKFGEMSLIIREVSK